MVTLVKRADAALLSRDYPRQHRLEITGNRGSAIRYRCLDYHLENGIATVTLDRQNTCNCVDQALATEIREVCLSIREEPGVRAVIFTGAGKHFSVGRASPPPAIAGGSASEKLDWLRSVQVASSIAAIEVPVLVGSERGRFGPRAGNSLGGRHPHRIAPLQVRPDRNRGRSACLGTAAPSDCPGWLGPRGPGI